MATVRQDQKEPKSCNETKRRMTIELTYTRVGDYLIPDLTADTGGDAGLAPMGRYGRLRERFLKEHHHSTYTSMLLTGRLEPYLYQIDRQAQMQVDQIVTRLMRASGVGEAMKARDQLGWVQAVNSFKAMAEERVLAELIYD